MAFPAVTNLASYWRFDESSGNAADSYGSNTLTNNNSVAYATGKIANGADLEQNNSNNFSIADGSQSGLDITGDISVSLWFKPESQPALDGIHVIVSKWNTTGNQRGYQFVYKDNSGTKMLGMYSSADGAAQDSRAINQTLNNATFYHIVFVYTVASHKLEIYVNGSSIGTDTGAAATALFNNTAPFRVGYDEGQNATAYLDGIVDEMSVWARALPASDVTLLYNTGTGITLPVFLTPSDTAGAPTESVALSFTVPITVSDTSGTPVESSKVRYGFPNTAKHSSTWVNTSKS